MEGGREAVRNGSQEKKFARCAAESPPMYDITAFIYVRHESICIGVDRVRTAPFSFQCTLLMHVVGKLIYDTLYYKYFDRCLRKIIMASMRVRIRMFLPYYFFFFHIL